MKFPMKPTRLLLFAGLCASLGFTACTKDDAQGNIKQQYAAMDAAFNKKDLAQYMSHLGPDFTAHTAAGKVFHHDDYQTMTSDNIKAGDVKVDTSASNIQVNGDSATVDSTSHQTGTITMPSDGKQHKIDATTYTKDTWKKLKDGWKLVSIDETAKSKISLDGTPQAPGK
jgi:ketosteroid isomerase-like protein